MSTVNATVSGAIWWQGYKSKQNKQWVPEVSVERESRDSDVSKHKVLHQEVQQFKQLEHTAHKQPIHTVQSLSVNYH